MPDFTLLYGFVLGIASTLVVHWILKIGRRRNLIRLLKHEINENVDFLVKASESDEKWPAFLLSDVYSKYLNYLYVLRNEVLSGVRLHYKHVQRFEQALRDGVEGHQGSHHIYQARADEALSSGREVLKLLN